MGNRSVRLEPGNSSVFTAVVLRPDQTAVRAHRVAARFARVAEGRNRSHRLVGSVFGLGGQNSVPRSVFLAIVLLFVAWHGSSSFYFAAPRFVVGRSASKAASGAENTC